MTQRDKIRKIAVLSFIAVGLGLGLYEKATALPEYQGKGKGFAGDVILSVAMDDSRIDTINIVSHSETEGIADPAFAELIPAILEAQNLEMDNIAGATYTSEAIKVAVQEAALQAGLKLDIPEAAVEEIKAVERGRGIEGRGDGYLGDIVVEVERSGDEIKNIWVVEHEDTASIADPAFEALTAAVLENQSTDVDMVAGATWTSEGFLQAVEDALDSDESNEYVKTRGTGEGYLDDIVVEVTRDGKEIVGIDVISHGDTVSLADPAFEVLKASVVENQSTDVDMVAGATWTSEGYLEAVKEAIAQKN